MFCRIQYIFYRKHIIPYMYYEVLVGSQRYHGDEPLTYNSEAALQPGTIVLVPLGRYSAHGIVLGKVQEPPYATKTIAMQWPFAKLPLPSLRLLQWMHNYYPGPFGQLVELFIPPSLVASLKIPENIPAPSATSTPPPLTSAQQAALHQINQHPASSVLIHGITGSGKTRIYLERALETLASEKSVVVLTPEIGLTQPLALQFKKYCSTNVYTVHSSLTPAKRRELWLSIALSTQPVIVIGPRSALFMPIPRIGLVVIDEAHDGAYKQDQSPHYQASRVAAKLRELHGAQLILGTATPLVADYYGFTARKLPVVTLTESAVVSDTHKKTVLVDCKQRENFSRSQILSTPLLEAIQAAIDQGEQSLLFLNKRGSARLILCKQCGWQAMCARCDVSLTFHADTHNLRCHSCDMSQSVPLECPDCKNPDVMFTSVGTKAIEQEVIKLFPGARVGRFDGDTSKEESLTSVSRDLHDGGIDIIIGTQTITKGFDLPKLSVVGVVQADTSMAIPDFSASERTFQLIAQISGRIGRGHRNGTLIVQTFNPENPVLQNATAENYSAFYVAEISERERYKFPPFTHLMTIRCTRASRKSAIAACNALKLQLGIGNSGLRIDGPSPRFIEKQRGKYTWQLILRSAQRTQLVRIAQSLGSQFTYDIDPTDLL